MRARNIKPGFFKSDDLAECSPLARLLFAGLWCLADREGRLRDRPKRIKAEALPYDECDVDALLDELQRRGFIIRYESDGLRCIWIPTFLLHQRPHQNEQASELPPYDEALSTMVASTFDQGDKSFEPSTQALRSDSLFSDSLIPERGMLKEERPSTSLSCSLSTNGQVPYGKIVQAWNDALDRYNSPLPRVSKVSQGTRRQQHIRARWKDHPDLETWETVLEKAARSDFLNGRVKEFTANFDWIVKSADNFQKILEGNFDNREGGCNGERPLF